MAIRFTATVTLASLVIAPAALGQWIDLVDQTSTRLPAAFNDPSLTTNDDEEKDYAWGDVDQDGDIDLVVVRKTPFTSTGKRVNLLLMNEGVAEGHSINGVLVDRTLEYASASLTPGDDGFMTPTNDRDVVLVDVDNDGWLDIVTATTLTDNQSKDLSHPRVYMNLGEVAGEWQGFQYEGSRIPEMHPTAGPRFCSVAAGDINGDGFADLYFGDYDSGGSQIFDYNNKLLVNDGTGNFIDESNLRLTGEMRLSAFGAASVITDMNNDGVLDVVKQTSLNAPQHVAITYNDPTDEGDFASYEIVNADAPYFVSAGDLNNDGRMDLVIVDDGTDSYMLNTGNGGDGRANFAQFALDSSVSSGFGGNSWLADLDNNGWDDIIITDVDVDIPGCQRETAFFSNNANGPNVTFSTEQNIVPQSVRQGVHDVAVFDLNGDGWLDIVFGQCDGTKVYMNEPPLGITFTFPGGFPDLVEPGIPTPLAVRAIPEGGEVDTIDLFVSVNGGGFSPTPMVEGVPNIFNADLPAITCDDTLNWYVRGTLDTGSAFTAPEAAPAISYVTRGSTGVDAIIADEIEGDVSGWRVTSIDLTAGEWEAAEPNGTLQGGTVAAPFEDASPTGTRAFVTGNGAPGESAGVNDVDGGPTRLETPIFDGTGGATIEWRRWMYVSTGNRTMTTEVSIDGGATYQAVPSLATNGTSSSWQFVSRTADELTATPTPFMRLRFSVSDNPNSAILEAGIDDFFVERSVCEDVAPCPGDTDGSGDVGFTDLVAVLALFGSDCDGCLEDVDGDGSVGFNDVVQLLAVFGPCE